MFLILSCEKPSKVERKLDNIFYDRAFDYREDNKPDSAFLYFNRAKDIFQQQKDSFGIGKCLVNMAIISTDKGDYYGGQEISLNAVSYLNSNNEASLVYIKSNFNNLGISSFNLKNYTQAIEFYQKSLLFTKDTAAILVIKNNIANAYRKKKQYQKSIDIYQDILRQPINKQEFARTLSNFAFTKWLQNPHYDAKRDLLKALHIREKENNSWGQNASYSHLSDYYSIIQPDSALEYATKMNIVANRLNSPDDRIESLEKLIKLSTPVDTKRYFGLYQKLNDSIQTSRNTAKNQFALIRYDAEKNKADNLKLQKDNTEKKFQIIKQRILLFTVLFITLTISVVSILWYKKRKQRLELEAENSIRNSQLKISKKVHDVVANGLYRVMTEIENQDIINKEHVLDKIEDLYEKSRDISYDKPEPVYNHFHEKISALLLAFATEHTLIAIAGNTPELWEKVSSKNKFEIEHILQELMVNMKKHSKASNVVVKFEELRDQFFIHYTDNGIGLPKEMQFKNGLTNTGNRIKSIHGEITFDTKVERGLKIQLSCPVS
ncbi:histidine kinase [Pedobacter antarcticus 4BY]|uniref:Histidine kinase n=2 Tax=Pedobacter antarcticus TaxID=34086 RepID=A0A081PM59_9SPHI|nr:histidine kinase [Pedobacter antarcticus 4BY]